MQNENNSTNGFRDAGQWKLTIEISAHGMTAVMSDSNPNSKESKLLFQKNWECEDSEILKNIETTVYDNPQILDDFSTEIIISTDKILWVPTEKLENEDDAVKFFNCVYESEEVDIMEDSGETETCLYTMVPGLVSFIRRTLPGSRINSHLTLLKNYVEEEISGSSVIFVNLQADTLDIIVFKEKKLCCASVHQWQEAADVEYIIFLAAEAFSLDKKVCNIRIAGKKEPIPEIIRFLQSSFGSAEEINPGVKSEDLKLITQ